MIFPQEMSEVELVVPNKDAVAVTRALGGMGNFHQVDASFLNAKSVVGTTNPWQESAATLNSLERRVQILLQTLNLTEGQPPTEKLSDSIDLEATRGQIEQIEQEVRAVSETINNERRKGDQYRTILEDLKPLSGINTDIQQLRSAQAVHTVLGTLPEANLERMETSLQRVPHVILPLRKEGRSVLVWVAGQKSNMDVLDRAARSAYLTPLALPEGYTGTPAQLEETIQADIRETETKIETAQKEIEVLGKANRDTLVHLLWDIRWNRMLADAIVRLGRMKFTYIVSGWAPNSKLEQLKARLQQVSPETLIEVYEADRLTKNNVPVALSTNPILKAFQFLTTTYSRPRYSELDPTFLLAITFPLLYGMMFGDVGQGLVLALVGWLLSSRKVKKLRGLSALGGLLIACGLSASVFGFLYGSIFGFEHVLPALWMHPMQHIMDILIVAIVAGVILLNLGFLLNIYNNIRQKDWAHVFFFQAGLSGLLLYWGLLGLAGGALLGRQIVPQVVLLVMIVLGVLGIMLGEVFERMIEKHHPLFADGVGIFAIQAFFELFETVISFLSNTLSYVRVGAFAVAHGGLSAVIFILAEMASPGHGIGFWIVIVLGNLFIIGFEGLIVGIQTMRLEYYEFFSKFFKGGGLRYEPLSMKLEPND